METVQSVLSLVQPGCYMATIDLKDAHYSFKTDEANTAYLNFYLTQGFENLLFYQIECILDYENAPN